MAALFGFMTLVHGPVMTFAKANPSMLPHVSHHGAHHHGHHPAPADSSLPAKPDSAPVCYAFGCFIALDAVAPGAPSAILNPIGTLSPAPAAVLRADDIEPAIPPPRLHA